MNDQVTEQQLLQDALDCLIAANGFLNTECSQTYFENTALQTQMDYTIQQLHQYLFRTELNGV